MQIFYLGLKPTIKQLIDVLKEKVDWYELGIQLDITTGVLKYIKEDNDTAKQRLIAMLEKWLSKYPEKGWSHIVDALRQMEKNDVADDVNEKYCSAVSSSVSHYSGMKGTCVCVCVCVH